MQFNLQYQDVIVDVSICLKDRINQLIVHGIEPHWIAIDPGFGFGF